MRTVTMNFPQQLVNIGRNGGSSGRSYWPVTAASFKRLQRLMLAGSWACIHRNDFRGTLGFCEIVIADRTVRQ